jgi:hypothetical protein
MGGRGGRPVEEGAKGIVWVATLPDNGIDISMSLQYPIIMTLCLHYPKKILTKSSIHYSHF